MGIDARSEGIHGNGQSQKPTTSAAELSQVAADIEAFLGLWVARFESLLDNHIDSSKGEEGLRERIAKFEIVQRHWNKVREQEVQQIQETTEQLSAAWERLEDERRRVLQTQETLPQRAFGRDSAAMAKPGTVPKRASTASTADPHHPGDLEPEEEASVARDRAVRQFEKLKRQMGISTP